MKKGDKASNEYVELTDEDVINRTMAEISESPISLWRPIRLRHRDAFISPTFAICWTDRIGRAAAKPGEYQPEPRRLHIICEPHINLKTGVLLPDRGHMLCGTVGGPGYMSAPEHPENKPQRWFGVLTAVPPGYVSPVRVPRSAIFCALCTASFERGSWDLEGVRRWLEADGRMPRKAMPPIRYDEYRAKDTVWTAEAGDTVVILPRATIQEESGEEGLADKGVHEWERDDEDDDQGGNIQVKDDESEPGDDDASEDDD